jgi:hypothetical protein
MATPTAAMLLEAIELNVVAMAALRAGSAEALGHCLRAADAAIMLASRGAPTHVASAVDWALDALEGVPQ